MKKYQKKMAARKKILKHLIKRGGEGNFIVTPALVLYWWHYLNKALFNDELIPPYEIVCKRFHSRDGWCEPWFARGTNPTNRDGLVRLGINSEMYDRKTFLETLAHEMVHQWEWHSGLWKDYPIHGKTFTQWKKPLKEAVSLILEK